MCVSDCAPKKTTTIYIYIYGTIVTNELMQKHINVKKQLNPNISAK